LIAAFLSRICTRAQSSSSMIFGTLRFHDLVAVLLFPALLLEPAVTSSSSSYFSPHAIRDAGPL
jgi:hypothetical protein